MMFKSQSCHGTFSQPAEDSKSANEGVAKKSHPQLVNPKTLRCIALLLLQTMMRHIWMSCARTHKQTQTDRHTLYRRCCQDSQRGSPTIYLSTTTIQTVQSHFGAYCGDSRQRWIFRQRHCQNGSVTSDGWQFSTTHNTRMFRRLYIAEDSGVLFVVIFLLCAIPFGVLFVRNHSWTDIQFQRAVCVCLVSNTLLYLLLCYSSIFVDRVFNHI